MFHDCFSFFQSLRLFRLAAELEGKAAALRKEALQHLTIALAGTNTRELFTLLVTFFGKGTDVDPFSFIDAAPVIKCPLDLTDTESESEEGGNDAASTSTGPGRAPTAPVEPSSSTSAPSVKKPIKIRQKATYQDKCVDVQGAIGFLPENPGSLHNTGIPDQFSVHRMGKNDHSTSIYACPYPECSDPPYTGDISGCQGVACPYCSDKKYYNANGWHHHMREKHNKAPWYSGEVHAPPASATEATPASSLTVQDPVLPVVSVSAWPESEVPEDTLPHVETLQDDDDALLDAEPTDPTEPRPPTPSTKDIEHQLEWLPSDTRHYEYSVHQTHHPAAPVIVSRFRSFDTPDDAQQVVQAIVASTTPDYPDLDSKEGPVQCKHCKVDPSIQIESTRSLKWQPHREDDPDDDAPTSMA